MPCLYHSHLPIKPLLCLPSPNLWPLYYCYIYMHLYTYINIHTCIYNLLSPFNVAHMCMCLDWDLGFDILGVSSSMGETVLSLKDFDRCSSSCRVGTLWNFLRLYWHVSWCRHFAGLVQATILLKFMGVFLLLCLGNTIHSTQASWPLAFIIFPPPSMTFPEPSV